VRDGCRFADLHRIISKRPVAGGHQWKDTLAEQNGSFNMKARVPDFKPELAPVFLVLLSFIPLMLTGFILDILLIHFFSMVKGNAAALNTPSLWVYNNLAGYRFLPQELMAGFWFLMIISIILIFSRPGDPQRVRFNFLFSFLLIWGTALSVAGSIAFACIKPFDLLLARVEDPTWVGCLLPSVLIGELLAILLIPIGFFLWKKAIPVKTNPPELSSPDKSVAG
jgi:hypothetical protein